MGTSRQMRKSEEYFNGIWIMMRNLCVCVWHPLPDNAVEIAEEIIIALKEMVEALKEEANNQHNNEFKNG